MYSKPEVSRYTGLELLDLMGPVETAYDCDLDGREVDGGIEFILETPDGRSLDDLFPEFPPVGGDGIGTVLTPTGGQECPDAIGGWPCEGFCVYEEPALTGSETSVPLLLADICGLCDATGEWTLKAWWIVDGKELPSCTEKVDFTASCPP
jgi:hypothetical protein